MSNIVIEGDYRILKETVNPKTGECTYSPLGDGDSVELKLTTAKQREAQRNYQIMRQSTLPSQVFVNAVFADRNSLFCSGLPFEYVARLCYLATYINYDDNKLIVGSTSARCPMSKKDMERILNISIRSFYAFFNNVVKPLDPASEYGVDESTGECIGYIYERGGCLYMNKKVFFRGQFRRGVYAGTIRLFCEQVRTMYESVPIEKHRALGMVFALLPYVNLYSNTICKNPLEKESGQIRSFTQKELNAILGFNTSKYRARFDKIKKELVNIKFDVGNVKRYFCAWVEVGEFAGFVVNPNIAFGSQSNLQAMKEFLQLQDVSKDIRDRGFTICGEANPQVQ